MQIKSANKYIVALLMACSICMFVILASATYARADDASSTPGTAQTSTDTSADTSGSASTVTTGDASSNSSSNDETNTNTTDASASTTTVADTNAATSTDDTSSAGQTGTNTASSTIGDANVTTGGASSDTESQNQVNGNTTTANSASTTVEDTNDATSTTNSTSTADTGTNLAVSAGGNASIATGQALASANVINVVNTNIVNSEGLIAFLNAFYGGGYDLRNLDLSYFTSTSPTSDSCSLNSCDASSTTLTVSNTNNADVNNTVIAEASTGGNTASSTIGTASIATGDAAASANVVNAVNTNITNSHYLLVVLNNFGDLGGDITLPSASFFQKLFARSGEGGNTTLANSNAATVNSTTTAEADTGGNNAVSGGGDASVSTGNALSGATSVNQVNTNLTGGTTVFMLVNVFGSWTGDIQGLPSGLSWIRTPNGVAITGAGDALSQLSDGTTTISNTNTAAVNNNVQVYALTGQNFAGSASGGASVATGNAYASANVVNLVNTNVLGENWILAIMNVFGNWTGNLSFGHPDLWIGAVAQTGDPTAPGSVVTYTFTVANHGDADATNVVLNAQFDPTLLTFNTGQNGDGASWNLGTIAAGATEQYSYTATAGDPGAGKLVTEPLTATVTESEDDANTADNTDSVTIAIGTSFPVIGDANLLPATPNADLTINKTESTDSTTSPAAVDYQVVIDNGDKAGPAYGTILSDTITGPDGSVVYQNSWNVDEIDPGDEVTLSYSVNFDASSTPGEYTNVATLTGFENYDTLPYATRFTPLSSTTTLQITAPAAANTLQNVSMANSCTPLITATIMRGQKNNASQVEALQTFLNTNDNAGLTVNGAYDAATIQAVEQFQTTHAGDILAPWGITGATGNVSYTTMREINNLNCGTESFTLTAPQLSTITSALGTHHFAAIHNSTPLAHKKDVPTAPPIVITPVEPQKKLAGTPGWLDRIFEFGAEFMPIANALSSQ